MGYDEEQHHYRYETKESRDGGVGSDIGCIDKCQDDTIEDEIVVGASVNVGMLAHNVIHVSFGFPNNIFHDILFDVTCRIEIFESRRCTFRV